MSYEYILTRTEGKVGIVQFNRPKALNALSPELMDETMSALEAFDADDPFVRPTEPTQFWQSRCHAIMRPTRQDGLVSPDQVDPPRRSHQDCTRNLIYPIHNGGTSSLPKIAAVAATRERGRSPRYASLREDRDKPDTGCDPRAGKRLGV